MPLKPQRNGRIWRQQIAKGRADLRKQRRLITDIVETGPGRADLRKQRRLITDIVETGPGRAELYQMLVAIALLAGQIDDILESLDTDFRDTNSQ